MTPAQNDERSAHEAARWRSRAEGWSWASAGGSGPWSSATARSWEKAGTRCCGRRTRRPMPRSWLSGMPAGSWRRTTCRCEVYGSCEPCPMCLGAIYWTRIGRVCFAVNRRDAAGIELRDEFIYEELAKPFEARAADDAGVVRRGAGCLRRVDASGGARQVLGRRGRSKAARGSSEPRSLISWSTR